MCSFRRAGTPRAGFVGCGLTCLVSLGFVLPCAAQSGRSKWVEPVRVTAEVVPMPARFGPLVATMLESTAPSPFGTGSIGLAASPPPAPAPSSSTTTGTIALSAVSVTEGTPDSVPGPAPTFPAPDRLDLPPLMEPTGTHGVAQSYLVAAAGPAALGAVQGPPLGAATPARAMIRLHDGHSGRSVVMASREGVGDGRLVITVVFN